MNFSSGNNDQKKFEKINVTVALNVLYVTKEKKYILVTFQSIIQIAKSKLFF